MKDIIIGFILGLSLALCINASAYSPEYSDWEQEVIDLLEEINYNGDEIIGKIETNIDAVRSGR